jgi:hypothetical protein
MYMALRLPFGRALVTAGVLAAVVIPVATGVAYANAATHHKKAKPAATTLSTRVPHARIVTKPTTATTARTVATLHAVGTKVKVNCYKSGASVNGDTTWYHTVAPKHGYIAGALLSISSEPAAGVPQCKAKVKAKP